MNQAQLAETRLKPTGRGGASSGAKAGIGGGVREPTVKSGRGKVVGGKRPLAGGDGAGWGHGRDLKAVGGALWVERGTGNTQKPWAGAGRVMAPCP